MPGSSFPQIVSSRSFVTGVLARLQDEQQRWYKQLQGQAERLPDTERLVLTPPAPRSASNRLRVVVLGPTKAGKSTLLNALLGRYALPTNEGRETTRAVSVVHRQGQSTPQLWRSDGQLLATGDEQIAAWLHQAHIADRRGAKSNDEGSTGPYYLEIHACMPGLVTPTATNSDGVDTEFIDIPGYGELDPQIRSITAAQVSQADMILLVFKIEQLDSKEAENTATWLRAQRQDLQGKVAMMTCVLNFQRSPDQKSRDAGFDKARKLLSEILSEGSKIPLLHVKADHALFARLQVSKRNIPEILNAPLQTDFSLLREIDVEATWILHLEEHIMETIYLRSGLRLLQSQTSRVRKEIEKNELEVSNWIFGLKNKHKKITAKIKEIENQAGAAFAFSSGSGNFRTRLDYELSQDLDNTVSKLEEIYNAPELAQTSYYWEDDAKKAHIQRNEYLMQNAIPVIQAWERKVCDVAERDSRQAFGVIVKLEIPTDADSHLGTGPKNRIGLRWKILTVGIAHFFDQYDLKSPDFEPRTALKKRQKKILDTICANIKQKCTKKSYSIDILKFKKHADRLNEYITLTPATCSVKYQLDELDFLIAQAQAIQPHMENEDKAFSRNVSEGYENMQTWVASAPSPSSAKDTAPRSSAIAAMRLKLEEKLKTDADFDAFCLDCYPEVYNRFSSGMDTVHKKNLLLSMNKDNDQLADMHKNLDELGQGGTQRLHRGQNGLQSVAAAEATHEQAVKASSATFAANAEGEAKPKGITVPRSVDAVNEVKRAVSGPIERPPLLIARPFYRQPRFWIAVIVVLLLLIFAVASMATAYPVGRPQQRALRAADTAVPRFMRAGAGG